MSTEVHGGALLSGMEALMWRLEVDRSLSATFGTVSFLDAVPDRSRFTSRLAAAARDVPRLRQRVQPARLPGTPPSWVLDEHFDLDHHLAWDEPASGEERSDADVLTLASRLVAEPFTPDRPLWNFVVVSGLEGGRAALLQRMHHALTDGEGGIRLSELFVDASPDAPDPVPDPLVGDDAPPPDTTWGERAALTTAERVGEVARGTASVARWTLDGLRDPRRFGAAGAEALEAARSLRRQLLVLDAGRSPLWTDRSGTRRLVVGSVPFAPVREAANRLGVSVNDLFVTAVLRGAAAYHRALGAPVPELRIAVPVSTRHSDEEDHTAAGGGGGNAFSPTRAVLPSGDGFTAAVHVGQVTDRLAVVKHERSNRLVATLAGAADVVPTSVLTNVVRRQGATVDLVASNLRAAPFPLYVGGARIEATYALGPLVGAPVNVTMMTYDGRVDLGIHVDDGAVTDPEMLRDNLVGAFHEVSSAPA